MKPRRHFQLKLRPLSLLLKKTTERLLRKAAVFTCCM